MSEEDLFAREIKRRKDSHSFIGYCAIKENEKSDDDCNDFLLIDQTKNVTTDDPYGPRVLHDGEKEMDEGLNYTDGFDIDEEKKNMIINMPWIYETKRVDFVKEFTEYSKLLLTVPDIFQRLNPHGFKGTSNVDSIQDINTINGRFIRNVGTYVFPTMQQLETPSFLGEYAIISLVAIKAKSGLFYPAIRVLRFTHLYDRRCKYMSHEKIKRYTTSIVYRRPVENDKDRHGAEYYFGSHFKTLLNINSKNVLFFENNEDPIQKSISMFIDVKVSLAITMSENRDFFGERIVKNAYGTVVDLNEMLKIVEGSKYTGLF